MIYMLTVPAAIPEVEEIRVLEWHFDVGEEIAVDNLIVELETHKAVIEVRAAQSGFVRRIDATAGTWARVNERLAIITSSVDEDIAEFGELPSELLVNFAVT